MAAQTARLAPGHRAAGGRSADRAKAFQLCRAKADSVPIIQRFISYSLA